MEANITVKVFNSLKPGELSKIFSWNLCIAKIIIFVRISSPKGHTYKVLFQLEILIINVIYGIVYFREIILESLRNICETTPRSQCVGRKQGGCSYINVYIYYHVAQHEVVSITLGTAKRTTHWDRQKCAQNTTGLIYQQNLGHGCVIIVYPHKIWM